MAAVIGIQRDQTGIKAVGTHVTVSSDPYARLMYYLSCVHSCVPDLEIPLKYRTYATYYNLNDQERIELTVLCYLLSPDVFDGKLFFLLDNDKHIPGGKV